MHTDTTTSRRNYSYSGVGSLGSRSKLPATHTARVYCTHCMSYHQGESYFSLESAYNQAIHALDMCRSRYERLARQQADSTRNAGGMR